MQEESCRGGVENVPTLKIPGCGGPYDPGKYQELGLNYTDIHPPTYYLLTGITARIAVDLGLFSDFVDAGRALGGVWLAAGLWFLALAMRRLGALRTLTGAAVLGTGVAPLVIKSTAIVSNDATTLFTGSLVLWVVVRYVQSTDRSARALWPLVLASVAVAWLRATSVLGVLIGAGVVLVAAPAAAADDARVSWRSYVTWERLRAPLSMLVATFVATELWLGVRGALKVHAAVPNLVNERQHATSLAVSQVTDAIHAFLPLFAYDTSITTGAQHVHQLFVTLLSWVLVAAAAGAAVAARRPLLVPSLGGASVLVLVLGAPFLIVTTSLSQSAYFAIPVRYGIAVVPFVVAGGVAASNRLTQRLLFGLFVLSAVFGWCLLLTGSSV